jgi:cobalamin biosynthesis Mg chelatase CobN
MLQPLSLSVVRKHCEVQMEYVVHDDNNGENSDSDIDENDENNDETNDENNKNKASPINNSTNSTSAIGTSSDGVLHKQQQQTDSNADNATTDENTDSQKSAKIGMILSQLLLVLALLCYMCTHILVTCTCK